MSDSDRAAGTVTLRPPAGVALRRVLDLTSQLLCVCDVEGRVLWCNLGFAHALGFPAEDVPGRCLAELTDDRGRAALLGSRTGNGNGEGDGDDGDDGHAGSAGSEIGGVLARMRRSDGVWRTVEWTTRCVSERGLVYFAGRDVTDSMAVEEAVRAGEARLRAIVAHSPSAIFVKDLDGRYLLVNDAWATLTGRATHDMLGRTDAECPPAVDAPLGAIEADLTLSIEASRGGHPSIVRDMTVRTSDDVRVLMVSLFALCTEEGIAYAACGIASDITERKRAEAALEARQVVLDTILEACPDIISLLDAQGRIRHVSAAEQTILGYRHDDPSSALYSLVHPDDFDDVASAFISMVAGARSQLHVRYRVLHADGRWITVDSRAQAVADEEGRFVGAVVVTRDVSSQLGAETRLREARQAADTASRAKSEFLSRMSHELRTPLNAILGFSQLLQMDDLALPQAEAVEHILRAGHHLLELIDDVLDIARIETGHLELAVRAVMVAEVIAEVASTHHAMAERAEVVVQTTLDTDDSLAVLADRQRLVQVLSNLVSNAIKYNRPGGHVDLSCAPAPGGVVRFSVADTGQGIRAEELDRVFEPFDRLGAEQSGVEGTGVGLALARHLVERMNGRISVESVPEVGSTFFVELPMAVVPEEGHGGAPRRVGAAGDSAASATGFRVLLVEQDLSSRELVDRVLARRPGVTVLAARDGASAIELARSEAPDLILLDLQLPDMAGSALLDELGQDRACSSIPVAVLSGESSTGQVRRLLGRGVAGQLAKPIDVRALLSLVDAARAASGK